jgi:cell division protein FtsB
MPELLGILCGLLLANTASLVWKNRSLRRQAQERAKDLDALRQESQALAGRLQTVSAAMEAYRSEYGDVIDKDQLAKQAEARLKKPEGGYQELFQKRQALEREVGALQKTTSGWSSAPLTASATRRSSR